MSGEEVTKELVEEIFHTIDRNDSGQISYKEFMSII